MNGNALKGEPHGVAGDNHGVVVGTVNLPFASPRKALGFDARAWERTVFSLPATGQLL